MYATLILLPATDSIKNQGFKLACSSKDTYRHIEQANSQKVISAETVSPICFFLADTIEIQEKCIDWLA
uniref:AlNc14C133G7009 protein n=1 Tax=Albugo laibachii Nc14 TaxID=890382 RepID=F0WKF7_9STRA|nr:AlNc14C133G7009 [Albugo laibachii Nc14]|eukprot:CCA21761.1 AlNc14C133G7009 [Albugo laibachii Nc14]